MELQKITWKFFFNTTPPFFKCVYQYQPLQFEFVPLIKKIISHIKDTYSYENNFTDFFAHNVSKTFTGYHFLKSIVVTQPIFCTQHSIFLGENTHIEAGATIQQHCAILGNTEVRQGCYIRENVVVGEHCTLGHATEIKNSIMCQHTEAGHFNYIGDSFIAPYCNLGAGTKICNLAFRNLNEKSHQKFPLLSITINNKKIQLPFQKMGCYLGEGTETGCNSVLGPLALLGKNCHILPNIYLGSGIYPEHTFIKHSQDGIKHRY